MAEVVATVSGSLALLTALKQLLESLMKNKLYSLRDKMERLLETLESLESFYNGRRNDELYKKPGISKIFQNTWALLKEIEVRLNTRFPRWWTISKKITLARFVQRSRNKLQRNEEEMDRLIQLMVNERALERVPLHGSITPNSDTDGPGANSATDGPVPVNSAANSGTDVPDAAPNSASDGPAANSGTDVPAANSGTEVPDAAPNSAADGPAANSGTDVPAPNSAADGPAANSVTDGPAPNSATDGPAPNSARDGPAPTSATDGPGLSQRLSISSNHSKSTMSGTVAMAANQMVQVKYTPIDYPRFKMTLIECLGDTEIDKIVACLNIPDGLMSGGSNKGDGAKLKMVKLLERKRHISKDSIDGLITALQDLSFKRTTNTISKLYQDVRGSEKGFGKFKPKLAEQFTNNIMYGLATVLNFKPAEVDDLNLIPDRKGMKFVFILEQRNIISEEDVSELIKTLDAIGDYDNLLKKLKEMTNATDHIDLK